MEYIQDHPKASRQEILAKLKEMEKDDWKPTKKIIDFMKMFGWEIAAGNEPVD